MPEKISMTPVEAIHTAARHYCMEQGFLWRQRYAASNPNTETGGLPKIYSRYNVLAAILCEVERVTPHELTALSDMVEWLTLAGEAAQNIFTERPTFQANVAYTAMQEERTKFVKFVQSFALAKQWEVEPLPYRRTLSKKESQSLWDGLTERWGVDNKGHGWYPLAGTVPPHTVVFRSDAFEERFGTNGLAQVLSQMGFKRTFELNELSGSEPEYEIDVASVHGLYTGGEMYWTRHGSEWLIYASHEGTVTIAGKALIEAIEKVWPEYHLSLIDWFD